MLQTLRLFLMIATSILAMFLLKSLNGLLNATLISIDC